MFGMCFDIALVCCWHGVGMVLVKFWFNVAMSCIVLVFAGIVLK